MVIFKNSLINLDYDPATDIAVAIYPDLHDFLLPEIKHSIDSLIDTIKGYDINLLFLDGAETES